MSRIDELNRRYAASASLARTGVDIIAVGDPSGARLNAAVRRLLVEVRDADPGLWDDLVGAAKALRWRRITQPQPTERNPDLQESATQVALQAMRLRGAVADEGLLEELRSAAVGVAETDAPTGGTLLRSIEEVGVAECAVVAASRPAQAGLQGWLHEIGVVVLTASELNNYATLVDQAYIAGPPRFFSSSLITAPRASEISFVMPAWFGDRTVPQSAIAPFAERAIRIEARVLSEGDTSDPDAEEPAIEVDDEILPQPLWGVRKSPDREPASHEVEAHKVLLCGDLAIWLDDGDRIRALDPLQPIGERVIYTEVDAVRPGTYLLLRRGETERGALYAAALNLLGKHSIAVDHTQKVWKSQLAERLSAHGYQEVVRRLRVEGIKTAERARAWTEPNLVRPHSDTDFERLLEWLGIPIQPTFGHATRLRRMLYQASADIREQLEDAVSAADLSLLERNGYLTLDVKTGGFRGIVATRVQALSPYTEIVARHDARVPFPDRSGQWLE